MTVKRNFAFGKSNDNPFLGPQSLEGQRVTSQRLTTNKCAVAVAELVGQDQQRLGFAADGEVQKLMWLASLQDEVDRLWVHGKTTVPGNLKTRAFMDVEPTALQEAM